jgi:Ca2+-binding EF-hand superfamily protein
MQISFTLIAALILTGYGTCAMAQTSTSDAMATAVFSRLDADKDGSITTAEMTAHKAAQFARADRDNNGVVDAVEMATIRDRIAKLAATATAAGDLGLSRMDRDGDGALSLTEYTARAPLFVLMDGNGDGAVSRDEFDRARAAFAN